ncbi:MAG: hypothetical protein PF590_08690 [Candidatus Delongbacteria bacterium]|nr:hypothetical protein [Candidatus Delongbacteria bacterium]
MIKSIVVKVELTPYFSGSGKHFDYGLNLPLYMQTVAILIRPSGAA